MNRLPQPKGNRTPQEAGPIPASSGLDVWGCGTPQGDDLIIHRFQLATMQPEPWVFDSWKKDGYNSGFVEVPAHEMTPRLHTMEWEWKCRMKREQAILDAPNDDPNAY